MITSRKFEFERVESYLPTPRHRKPRYRDVPESFVHQFRVLSDNEAPIAVVRKNSCDECGDYYRYGEGGNTITYRWLNGEFWVPVRLSSIICLDNRRNRPATVNDIYLCNSRVMAETAGEAIEGFKEYLDSQWAIIAGRLHTTMGEPRYVVQTFGLGCNHGGTAILIEHGYNGNIPKGNYFRLDQLDATVEFHKETALARGDDKSVPERGMDKVTILMPETIRCNPAMEHGDGDPFINQINALSTSKDTVLTGLGALALAFSA